MNNEFLDSCSLDIDIDGKADRYAQLLGELPAGLSEWVVQSALGDEEWRAIEPVGWRVRRTGYRV